jgi:cupin fold WbuC family metalloprotein
MGKSNSHRNQLKSVTLAALDTLVAQAHQSPRRRANLNLHDTPNAPIQRLAIAMEPDTVVFPHRHPQTFELLTPLRGRFLVLHFDDTGVVTQRAVLGEDYAVIENLAHVWHAVLSLDSGGVIFEVKQGPYIPLSEEDTAAWSRTTNAAETQELLDWYGRAKVGDRYKVK